MLLDVKFLYQGLGYNPSFLQYIIQYPVRLETGLYYLHHRYSGVVSQLLFHLIMVKIM